MSRTIYEQHIVSSSFFGYLVSEMVQYSLTQPTPPNCAPGEDKLHEMGFRTGYRIWEYMVRRESSKGIFKRETKAIGALTFLSTHVWRHYFGRNADIHKGGDNSNEYWITDRQMVFNKFVSASDSRTNCASWVAGMVEGCLTAAEFPCEVSAAMVEDTAGASVTTIVVNFDPLVNKRENNIRKMPSLHKTGFSQ